MLVLGLCEGPDAGVAFLDDGRVAGLVQRERMDRVASGGARVHHGGSADRRCPAMGRVSAAANCRRSSGLLTGERLLSLRAETTVLDVRCWY